MDFCFKNVRLIDPDTGAETAADVVIHNRRIQTIAAVGSIEADAQHSLDCEGKYLFPGFIDFHTHLFAHGSTFGLQADRMLSVGTTTAVDMGTAGWVNYPALHTCDLMTQKIRTYSFLNVSPIGQPGRGINEPLTDDLIDVAEMQKRIEEYPGEILGLKVRVSQNIVGSLGLQPLQRAVETGEKLGLPVCVHTTNPPEDADKIAQMLRPGDIYSHIYHGSGRTILGDDGHVRPGVVDAQKRGVIMDLGNGKVNFNFDVAEKAAADAFWPDLISSDSTGANFHALTCMWDLPTIMSKFLCLGMPLHKVLRAVTVTPAACLGLADRIGRIAPGYDADLVLCSIENKEVIFVDSMGNNRIGNQLIKPEMTVFQGQILKMPEK